MLGTAGTWRHNNYVARTLPALNLLEFYLWGRLECLVCATAVNDVAELHERAHDGCDLIRATPGMRECARSP